MAFIHPACGRVHPEGAVTCEQSRQMIEKRGQEIDHEVGHHSETCNCPNPREHVLKLRHERNAPEPWPRIIGAST